MREGKRENERVNGKDDIKSKQMKPIDPIFDQYVLFYVFFFL